MAMYTQQLAHALMVGTNTSLIEPARNMVRIVHGLFLGIQLNCERKFTIGLITVANGHIFTKLTNLYNFLVLLSTMDASMATSDAFQRIRCGRKIVNAATALPKQVRNGELAMTHPMFMPALRRHSSIEERQCFGTVLEPVVMPLTPTASEAAALASDDAIQQTLRAPCASRRQKSFVLFLRQVSGLVRTEVSRLNDPEALDVAHGMQLVGPEQACLVGLLFLVRSGRADGLAAAVPDFAFWQEEVLRRVDMYRRLAEDACRHQAERGEPGAAGCPVSVESRMEATSVALVPSAQARVLRACAPVIFFGMRREKTSRVMMTMSTVMSIMEEPREKVVGTYFGNNHWMYERMRRNMICRDLLPSIMKVYTRGGRMPRALQSLRKRPLADRGRRR